MKFENFNRYRKGQTRYYEAELEIEEEFFKMKIIEEYLTAGVKFDVSIKNKKRKSLMQKFKSKNVLPSLTKDQWYALYFEEANKR